jgi:hypothetical protein
MFAQIAVAFGTVLRFVMKPRLLRTSGCLLKTGELNTCSSSAYSGLAAYIYIYIIYGW